MTLTFSIADQNFQKTKSIGILNLSAQLLETLIEYSYFSRLSVFSNSGLAPRFSFPPQVKVSLHDIAIRNNFGRMWWDQVQIYREARRNGNEWLFLPKGYTSFLLRPPCRLAVYVQDASHDYYQKVYPGVIPRFEAVYFQQSLWSVFRYADLIVTSTEFGAREVKRLAEERGLRCPPVRRVGVGFRRPPGTPAAKENRVLVITGRWPHKRGDLAVKYLAEWQRKTSYAGTVEWAGAIPEGVEFPSFSNWKRLSRVPEPEFRRLVATSNALVYFSDYEGFGMPPVEAIIAGTCPVYSDLEPTREVTSGTGALFNNKDIESFFAAMSQALKTSPEQLAEWGRLLLAQHDWKGAGDRAFAALREVSETSSPLPKR